MKKIIFLTVLAATANICAAQSSYESARVLSSTPVVQQVALPRQVCNMQQVAVQPEKAGAGAIMGGIAGGAMGNAVGGGNGKTAATVLGLIGGAMLGNKIEGAPAAQLQNVQSCTTETVYENRTTGYNVAYEYAGKQYVTQMHTDPGAYVRIQITPASW
jgi:uncharacterized protein YcfJ